MNSQPGFEEVRDTLVELLEQTAAGMREARIDPRDYDDARFAVTVFVDETVLNASWIHRERWQKAMLQTELYASTSGGVEFFNRMNQLGENQKPVREVYYYCLALGLRGQYCNDGDEMLLDQLKKGALKQIDSGAPDLSRFDKKPLFDGAMLPPLRSGEIRPSALAWGPAKFAMIAGAPSVVVILFVVFYFVLSGVAENLTGRVMGS